VQISENRALHSRNTEVVFSDKAIQFLPEFKVASLEDGLRFAFEAAPRQCFELTGGKMPSGCHAWGRYDRAFWESHLLGHDAERRMGQAAC
jgi:hypothetical protein